MTEFSVVLIVLGFLGLINASYLMWKNSKKQQVVCPIGNVKSCAIVLESQWNKILFFKNEFLGIIYYLFIMIAGVFFFINYNNISIQKLIKIFLIVISSIALTFSTILVYIQAKKINSYCFYCMISALISLLIFINVFLL